MLQTIFDTLKLQTPEVTPEVEKLLILIKDTTSGRKEIQQLLQLYDEKNIRLRYIQPALQMGLIQLTIPDKPNSRLQKYRITREGAIHFISYRGLTK